MTGRILKSQVSTLIYVSGDCLQYHPSKERVNISKGAITCHNNYTHTVHVWEEL